MDDKKPALVPLNPPTVPDALPDIPGGELGLLPKQALTSDLKVTFPLWSGSDTRPGITERVILKWDDREVAEKPFTTPIDPITLFANIPMSELLEGTHALVYKAILASGNENSSEPVTITIDKTAPVLAGTRDPLRFPIDLIGNKVTASYLERNGNKLPATVPPYTTPKPGDRINLYWETAPNGLLLADYKELTQADMSLQVEFDGDMIVSSGDGTRWATYEVQDRAGNLSALSIGVELTVDAQPVPLTAPSVERSRPLGGGRGELDPLLVTGGAVVVVPTEIAPLPGDLITVFWTGVSPGTSHETSTPIVDTGGLKFSIPASKVPGNIGRDKVVEVSYSVARQGGSPQPSDKYVLTILPISEDRLPKPQCTEAAGSPATLRLSSVPNGANFTIAPWVFIAAGQKMHMWIEGVSKNGSDLYLDIFTDRLVTEAETTTRVAAVLPRSFLDQLMVNAVFWADIEVSFNEGATFLGFPRQNLNLVV